MKRLYIGMDLHKNTSTFVVKDKDGKLIESAEVFTRPSAIKGYLKRFDRYLISLTLEPVSQWYFYADLLQKMGIEVHLANPLQVKAIASARIKTDKIDANVLVDLLRTNLLPEAYFASLKVRTWKELVRFRTSLVHLRTQIKNKIHSILSKNGLNHPFTNLFGMAGREWLRCLKLADPFQSHLERYLLLIDTLDKLIKEVNQEIEKTINNHPQAKLLTTIFWD